MKRLVVLTTVFCVMNFSGCSYYELTHGETKPHVSFVNLSNQNRNVTDGSTIYVWSPKNNAAVINKEGKGCIQGADVFHNEDININVSNKLLEIVSGIAVSPSVTTDDKLAAINTMSKIVQLKTNTERTSYLSIGMFGLCQLYSNGNLTEAELKTLVKKLITESAQLGQKSEISTTVTSSEKSSLADKPKK